MLRLAAIAPVLLALAGCGDAGDGTGGTATPTATASTRPTGGRADIGGYELAWECRGEGAPTVVLEAGLGAAGTEEFSGFLDTVAGVSSVCTYDRAGTGVSDQRPDDADRVTASLMAEELHALLEAIGVEPPVVIAAHSYGGMPARAFAAEYPDDIAGLVLVDVSSEPEVPVYERLDAGPWIDGTDRIDIQETVRELRAAGDLGDVPLIVVTAGLIEDRWLATVPGLAARAQSRLAGLSSQAMHIVATRSGHFVHRDAPDVVVAAIERVVAAFRSTSSLPACEAVFEGAAAVCVEPGEVPHLVPA